MAARARRAACRFTPSAASSDRGSVTVKVFRQYTCRVIAHATLIGRDTNLETAQEVLHDVLRAADRRISIEEIQLRVSQHYNIKISEMHSPRRSRSVARPRQLPCALPGWFIRASLPGFRTS